MNCLTYFPTPPAAASIPGIMPSPFADTPHPLARQACEMLQQRLTTETHWPRDFFAPDSGKMFGVLVVRDGNGRIGFLSAFSGMMSGSWLVDGFVPPVFNPDEQSRFLPAGKAELADMAEQLQALENSKQRYQQQSELKEQIALMQQHRDSAFAELKLRHKQAKELRRQQRFELELYNDAKEQQAQMRALALASQHHKREAANFNIEWSDKLERLQRQLADLEQEVNHIKEARREKSRQLHDKVFASYRLFNFLHEQRPITDFFIDATPPAGAGDCAGPKLIHYAYHHQLQPLALAEFWWGASPAAGVRHHKQFYPACRGKCRPILPFMLRGVKVEEEPYYGVEIDADEPKIVYEDDLLLVVNKPSGLMSVPGKLIQDCVFNRLLQRYPQCPELRLVHRLDMSTSGLLLVAKNLKINKQLQKQFIQRTVEKRYEAVLSKVLPTDKDEGDIDLPMRVDFDDRPRQLICYEYGKPAKTHWQVISRDAETTRVYFYPLTGRTHQLRLHASHRDGLNAAIVGDDLYGQAGERLLLHAQRLCFTHPVSRERLEFEVPAPF